MSTDDGPAAVGAVQSHLVCMLARASLHAFDHFSRRKKLKHASSVLLLTIGLAAGAAVAQVPSVVSPGFAVDTMESIGSIADVGGSPLDGGVFIKALTVPSGRTFRLTDVSVDTRNANTSPNPCFFEIWRGTDAAPSARAWSRIRVFGSATYDRSWITGPQFAAGETVWLAGRFDPLNAGLRICSRNDVNLPTELRYAVRGYLVKSF